VLHYHPLHVDEAQPLAYIIAYDDYVWLEQSPAFGTRSVIELEAVLSSPSADFEDEGLVHVSEQGDGRCTTEGMAPLAQSPVAGLQWGALVNGDGMSLLGY
jgi:hypothetical protein